MVDDELLCDIYRKQLTFLFATFMGVTARLMFARECRIPIDVMYGVTKDDHKITSLFEYEKKL